MLILTVIGARPQFIKAAAVSLALKKAGIDEYVVHTGQHYDRKMSDIFFEEMGIAEPMVNLYINDLNHAAMTGRMMEKIEEIIVGLHKDTGATPDYLLVYGDTNSTLAGALTAAKHHIPVAHVEAGLRSFDMKMPEEVNRILTDRVSKILFCPTQGAVNNLEKEGFKNFNVDILNVGDVMLDTLLLFKDKAAEKSTILKELKLTGKDFVLATIHRAENTNDPARLKSICDAINEVNKKIPVLLPLHPRTKNYLESNNIKLDAKITEPLGYFDMLAALDACKLVMTDSGGLQKESYFCGKFCVTLRDQTEWVELVDAGANVIAGANKDNIVRNVIDNLNTKVSFDKSLYGDGHAAEQIAERLRR